MRGSEKVDDDLACESVTFRFGSGVPVGIIVPSDRHTKSPVMVLSSSPGRLQICKLNLCLGSRLLNPTYSGPNGKHLLRFPALSNRYRWTNCSELSIKWVSRMTSKFSKALRMGNGKSDLSWNLTSHSFLMVSRVQVALSMLDS